jgi:hypothetical protein
MPTEKDHDYGSAPGVRLRFNMDIPLWGVASAVGAGLLLLAGLYFSVDSLKDTMKNVQIEVKSGNTSIGVLSSEVNLLKFRADGHDAAIKRLQEQQVPGRK